MGTMSLAATAVINTALKRPQYLEKVLSAWQNARGIQDVHSFTLALGHDPDQFLPQLNAFDRFRKATGLGQRGRVKVDSAAARTSRGMGRAIGEAGNHVFADPAVEFVVFGEEDVIVSSDVLEYMSWARREFAEDERVLCACAHSVGGQGWDEPGIGALNPDADESAVRLLPYFNAWCWGVWRDRWESVMAPRWDWQCDSGGPATSGYDWNVHARIVPQGSYLVAIPDASRSQNIGQHGGWAANPADFDATQAASFQAEREPVAFRLIEATEAAA